MMRELWLSSYSKASHTVLQHWLWKFLKKQTESFAPLHKVFSKIKVDSPNSGTSVWTEIFLLYPPFRGPNTNDTKTPFRSYSATTPPSYGNPTPPSPGGRGSSRRERGMRGQNGPQADTDVQ
jgi:hypothetical protein